MKSHGPISVVHIASGDLWAGAEVQLLTLVKALHSFNNITIRIILLNHGELEKRLLALGILVEILDESRQNSFYILLRLIKILKSFRPDIVHTHRVKENIIGGIAAKMAGNIPTIRTSHGAPEHAPSWYKPHKWLINKLDKLTGRFLQKSIIAVSDDLAEKLIQDFPANKIHVIENGIDLDSIKEHANHISSSSRLKGQTIKIGLVGRLVPVKRVDIFIQVAHYFRDHYPHISANFYIFGDGPLYDQLTKLSADLGVTDIVHFEGYCDNIHRRIQELDVLVMPSDHEGLPMVLLEAMALGVPIIAHAIGGIPKLLCEGTCGVLITDHTESGYANAIHNAIEHPDNLHRFTEIALGQVYDSYNANNNAAAYLHEYYRIRGGGGINT